MTLVVISYSEKRAVLRQKTTKFVHYKMLDYWRLYRHVGINHRLNNILCFGRKIGIYDTY